jgi:hypothetical protein
MGAKLSSKQQAQLAYLETLPPKFHRIKTVIEEMSSLRVDDLTLKGFCRMLDEIKANANQLSINTLVDTAGLMSTMARRGGGLQMKVRGLRELLVSLKSGYDMAMRSATTPEVLPAAEEGRPER